MWTTGVLSIYKKNIGNNPLKKPDFKTHSKANNSNFEKHSDGSCSIYIKNSNSNLPGTSMVNNGRVNETWIFHSGFPKILVHHFRQSKHFPFVQTGKVLIIYLPIGNLWLFIANGKPIRENETNISQLIYSNDTRTVNT